MRRGTWVPGIRVSDGSFDTDHNHHTRWIPVVDDAGVPIVDEDGEPLRRQVVGGEGCPVCLRHDHTDETPFGWTQLWVRGKKPNKVSGDYLVREFRLPVPAWHFTCAACTGDGDLDGIAATCDLWSPEGARWRRENPHRFTGQLELAVADDGASF